VDAFLPVILQSFADFPILGENQDARCVFIETVDDENAVARILSGHIITNQTIGGATFFAFGRGGQQTSWLIDGDNVLIFVNNWQIVALMLVDAIIGNHNLIFGVELEIKEFHRRTTNRDLLVGDDVAGDGVR